MHGNIICASSLTAKAREKGAWGGYRKGGKELRSALICWRWRTCNSKGILYRLQLHSSIRKTDDQAKLFLKNHPALSKESSQFRLAPCLICRKEYIMHQLDVRKTTQIN